MRPGGVERREFEGTRHGTQTLIANFEKHCECNLDEAGLGVKSKSGICILHSIETRKAFLADSSHRIRFVYTPKHASWLNQVEIWFSVLVRRLLKRSSFRSTQELRKRILDFIDYFNATAKPLKWTYAGRPLYR